MVLMVPLLIMATSLVSNINTRVALVKGWVNSFLAFMGQVYIGFYMGLQVDENTAVALTAPPTPIINADNADLSDCRRFNEMQRPEQSCVCHSHPQLGGEA